MDDFMYDEEDAFVDDVFDEYRDECEEVMTDPDSYLDCVEGNIDDIECAIMDNEYEDEEDDGTIPYIVTTYEEEEDIDDVDFEDEYEEDDDESYDDIDEYDDEDE